MEQKNLKFQRCFSIIFSSLNGYTLGISSIWSGSIHREINDSMLYRYGNMLNRCSEDHTRLRNALFFLARSFLKKMLMAFLRAHLRAIYVICVYFDQLYSQISPQSKISIPNINKTRCLLSGIHLGDNFRHA